MPQDWFDIVRNAKRRNPRFTVVEMQRHEFKSTAALEEAVSNRKKDIDNGPVNWLKIRWLRFEKGQECILSFKESLNDVLPFRKVNLTKERNVGRPFSSLLNIQQESLYNDRRLVTLEKKNVQDLLPYIPPVSHKFFKNLPQATFTRKASATQPIELADDEIIYDDAI